MQHEGVSRLSKCFNTSEHTSPTLPFSEGRDSFQYITWLNKYCSNRTNLEKPRLGYNTPTYLADMLLIVTFNRAYYDIIPLIELIYRPAFQHILYCGLGNTSPDYNVNFISISDDKTSPMIGSFIFECVNKVIDLHLDDNWG